MARHVRIIGVACGSGAPDHGCADGPESLQASGFLRKLEGADDRLRWDTTIRASARATAALRTLHADPRLLALEIAEYNPHRDNGHETAKAVGELCTSTLG